MAYKENNSAVMDEDKQRDAAPNGSPPAARAKADDYEQQTVSIPISACPTPPKAGDMLQFKVVSVDANAGTVNAVYEDEPEDGGDGGSDSLAAEFNQPSAGRNAPSGAGQ